MHPVSAMKHWSHEVSEHLHNRHFWTGVGITLLIVSFAALLLLLFVKSGSFENYNTMPFVNPYMSY